MLQSSFLNLLETVEGITCRLYNRRLSQLEVYERQWEDDSFNQTFDKV